MTSQTNSVKLNVGGTVFETSKSTLTRFNGFFKTMLETSLPTAKNQENCIFVDRDPTHFRYFLNFMRDGTVKLPDIRGAVEELLVEANFYLLEGFVELCKQKLEETGNRLGIPNNLRILENYDQVLQLIVNPEKPVLIIYYTVDCVGILMEPREFSASEFSERYCTQFEIYFKKSEIVEYIAQGVMSGSLQFTIRRVAGREVFPIATSSRKRSRK